MKKRQEAEAAVCAVTVMCTTCSVYASEGVMYCRPKQQHMMMLCQTCGKRSIKMKSLMYCDSHLHEGEGGMTYKVMLSYTITIDIKKNFSLS